MPGVITGPPALSHPSRSISLAVRHGRLFVAFINSWAVYIFRDGNDLVQIIENPFDGWPIECVALDRRSGSLALSSGQSFSIFREVVTFRPALANEESGEEDKLDIRWLYAHGSKVQGSSIRCLSWGLSQEILVANNFLSLFHPPSGSLNGDELRNSWAFPLSIPVEGARFSPDASFIATYGLHDRLVKIWRRLSDRVTSSGAKTSDFDFIYLPHSRAVREFSWRQPLYEDLKVDNIVYTSCSDQSFRAWASDIPHDSHLLTCHESLNMKTSAGSATIAVVLDDDVFSWALAKALKNKIIAGHHEQSKALLERIGKGRPEIVMMLDAAGGMTAHALYNLGNRNHKSSSQEEFFRTERLGLLGPDVSIDETWVTADVQRQGDHDLLLFIGTPGNITIVQVKLLDLFCSFHDESIFEVVNAFVGHQAPIRTMTSSRDAILTSTDETGSSISWTSHGPRLRLCLDPKDAPKSCTGDHKVSEHVVTYMAVNSKISVSGGDYSTTVSPEYPKSVQIWGAALPTSFSGAPDSCLSITDPVQDISWSKTATADCMLLAIVSNAKVYMASAQLIETKTDQRWLVFWTFDLSTLTSEPISGVCFVGDSMLAVSASSHIFTFYEKDWARAYSKVRSPKTDVPVYHPNYLDQLILDGNLNATRRVLSTLHDLLVQSSEKDSLDAHLNLTDDQIFNAHQFKICESNGAAKNKYNALFEMDQLESQTDNLGSALSMSKAASLASLLRDLSVDNLNSSQKQHVGVVAAALVSVEADETSLDAMGLRFYLSYILMQKEATSTLDGSQRSVSDQDAYWAFKSEKQDILLSLVKSSVKLLTWQVAKASKIFYWLKDRTALLEVADIVAKAEFLKGDDRDPVSASIWYHAMRKKAVLLSLWRTCGSHPEHNLTTKILANDFGQPKWRTAANKNAFALLGKRRFEYAAAWFLLADSAKDAVSVCVRNAKDTDLAVAIARIYEDDRGPVLRALVTDEVLTHAKSIGSRILACWCLEILGDVKGSMELLMHSFTTSSRDTPALLPVYSNLRVRCGAHARERDFVEYIIHLQLQRGCGHIARHTGETWEYRSVAADGGAGQGQEDMSLEDFRERRRETLADAPKAVFEEPTLDSFAAFDF